MKLSPSNAERWMVCAGSAHLHSRVPAIPQTTYMAAGSDAHLVAEKILKNELPEHLASMTLPKATADAVRYYVDLVRGLEIESKSKALVEQFFSLSMQGEKINGKIDATILDESNGLAHVIDYKNGAGVIVDVINNDQLSLYAMGAYLLAKVKGVRISNYSLSIVQPLGFDEEIKKTWDLSHKDLIEIYKTIDNRIAYIRVHPGEFVLNEHCSFCPALIICPAVINAATADTKIPVEEILSGNNLRHWLAQEQIVASFYKCIKEYAIAQVACKRLTPKEIGMKWVRGITRRGWIDPRKIIEMLEEEGRADLIKKSLPTLGEMEELKGKKWVAENTVKPDGAVVLATVWDKREEIIPIDELEQEFKKSLTGQGE